MKKLFLIFTVLVTAISVHAQYRDVILPEKPHQPGYKNYNSEDAGFWCALELEGGSSVMVHSPNMQYAGLTFTGGYRINEFLRFGAGLGVKDCLHNADMRLSDNKFGVPIFANVRGNFVSAYDRDGVPFWSLNVGGITHEGAFVSPTIGCSFGGLRNNFQIGLSYTLVNFDDFEKKNRTYSYFGVKVGYEF